MDCQLTLGWALQPNKHNRESSFVTTFYQNEDEAKTKRSQKKNRNNFLVFAQTLPGRPKKSVLTPLQYLSQQIICENPGVQGVLI